MIPLGRGFFEFRFSCIDDLRSIWSNGAWNLNSGLFRLSRWSSDFKSFNQNQTHSQVWVRFHYLPLEYWLPRILFEIAGAIGTPILIDENTTDHSFGHYAHVVLDINLAGILPDSLWVEREEFAFDIEIEYEKPPYFCSTCNSIGHSSDHCKKDPANRIAREKVASKNDQVEKITQDLVTKRHVDECNKVVTIEDPIVFDILRSKEAADGVTVGDAINLEEELFTSISAQAFPVQSVQVEIIDPTLHNEDQTEDKQNYPDMTIVGP
jgi:hypothetical protein